MSRSATELHVLRLRATHGDAQALAQWRALVQVSWIRFPTLQGAALSLGVQRNTLARWIQGDAFLQTKITVQPPGRPPRVHQPSPKKVRP